MVQCARAAPEQVRSGEEGVKGEGGGEIEIGGEERRKKERGGREGEGGEGEEGEGGGRRREGKQKSLGVENIRP